MFFDIYKSISSKSLFNTLHIEIKHRTFFGQNKRYKKGILFLFATSNSSKFYFEFAILIRAEAQGSSV